MATGKINNPLAVKKNILFQGTGDNPAIVQLISGRTVTILIQGGDVAVASGATATIATMTEGIPAISAFAVCAVNGGSTNKYALFEVTDAGEVKVYNYSGARATYLFGSVTYLVE